MLRLTLLCAFLALLALSSAEWNRVALTWLVYEDVPTTEFEARNNGWNTFGSSSCETDDYQGTRYILDGDISAMILYNNFGQITGIQAGTKNMPSSVMIEPNGPWHQERMWNGTKFWTITMYFRDPHSVCNGTKKGSELVGDQLTLANSGNYISFPLSENQVKKEPLWFAGQCFATMGMHYWYNATADMDCDYAFPVFLLYNQGYLDSWGWAIAKMPIETSPRWEHPSGPSMDLFLPDDPPQCLYEDGLVMSTMHVYFDNALFNFC